MIQCKIAIASRVEVPGHQPVLWRTCGDEATHIMVKYSRRTPVCAKHRELLDYTEFGQHGGMERPRFIDIDREVTL